MSSPCWLIIGLLVIIPLNDAVEIKDKSPGRHRRSVMNLNNMVKEVTGRDGTDFLGYGNWCGLGGAGKPIDPIDECCQIHDYCYDLTIDGACRKQGEKAVYRVDYKWKKTSEGKASCEEEADKCKTSICLCDAIITNCFKSNIDSYDEENRHNLNLFEIMKEADWLTSS